ncbi:GTPase ObgE [Agrilactobacillus fermenti]|uniref:GTPase ObgE n=1 Tax=Agrilactobacillus fermenti TaxID=2586909 RepID=UPI001E550D8E|nr:GTPase ObgE [Agrilactobacillus fermenti]MCD2255239.1 GTPase ObgE [Agrilactobacillus fermenti]
MFVDQVKIQVKAGKGGDGAVAFRKEKYVPKGGPAGGDGGKGGSIVLVVDPGLRTLMDFRYKRIFKAANGENGMNKSMYGHGAEDTVIKVPQGTMVKNAETDELIGDLTEIGQQLVVAQGGRGGRGNIHFANSRRRAPEIAENGEPGQDLEIKLELRVIADVGLVGYPSVGKSTLLSVATSAKPKIAAYHFTTLVPNLGMVQLSDGRDFVMADLPGLIEGASNGVGLGFQFLRHIERTRVILHLVDMDPENGRVPIDDFEQINHELETYDPTILNRPQIIVATKLDLPGAQERLDEFKQALAKSKHFKDATIFAISSVTHSGVRQLLTTAATALEQIPKAQPEPVAAKTYDYETQKAADFAIHQDETGAYIVTGEKVERLLKMTNLNHDDSVLRFARQLKSMGIEEGLRAAGAKNGDTVTIADFSFEFVD